MALVPIDDSHFHSENYKRNLHRYQLYAALLDGGERVLRPELGTRHPISSCGLQDNSYLDRLPGETSYQRNNGLDAFLERRNSAAHDPVSSRIVWCYVDTLFKQSIDRTAVEKTLGSDVLSDVDLKGSGVDDWLSWAYYVGLGMGWCVALIDQYVVEDDVPSAAHAPAEANRPYAQIYNPINILDIEEDEFGRVTMLTVAESDDTVRVWDSMTATLYDRKTSEVISVAEHEFGYVPAVVFRAQDPDGSSEYQAPGISAIKTIALFELQILQQLSLLNDVEKKTAFPFLHVERDELFADDAPEGDQTLGSDFIMAVEANVKWVSPSPALPEEIRNYCDWLESRSYKIGGVHRRSQDSVEAHSGLALDWENSPIYATVKRWARRLQTFESRIWKMFADIMDIDPSGIMVIYPDDFSSSPVSQDLGSATSISNIYGGYQYAPDFAKAGINSLVSRALTRLCGSDEKVAEEIERYESEPIENEEPDTETREFADDSEADSEDLRMGGDDDES